MKKSWISLFLLIFIYNCADPYFANLHSESNEGNAEYKFVMEYENTGISKDNNDYFHLTIDRNNWQTLYRVRGIVYKDDEPAENIKFYWDSNLYWIIGDTLGYIIKRGLSDDVEYVSYDTTYITQFSGFEVPTTNTSSVSNSQGEISNMIAPVTTMVGDTLILSWIYFDWVYDSDTYAGEMKFVLE